MVYACVNDEVPGGKDEAVVAVNHLGLVHENTLCDMWPNIVLQEQRLEDNLYRGQTIPKTTWFTQCFITTENLP